MAATAFPASLKRAITNLMRLLIAIIKISTNTCRTDMDNIANYDNRHNNSICLHFRNEKSGSLSMTGDNWLSFAITYCDDGSYDCHDQIGSY